MPLPPSLPREQLHLRHIELRGYRRVDGLYDVEAHLVDTKAQDLILDDRRCIPRGERIHAMSVRLVVDGDFYVKDVFASTDASPYAVCRDATETLQCIRGLRIGAGWSQAIRERLAGSKGCTHLTELLKPLATVAYQTLSMQRKARAAAEAQAKPRKIDSCYAYASHRDLVRARWPTYYMSVEAS